MVEKDKNQIEKIAKQCARDYSILKNKGVDPSSMPPRQWIRAWMQTHYNIIKLSGYFFREIEKALSPKYTINEGFSNLGLSSKVKSKYNAIDSVDNLEVGLNKTVFEKMKKILQDNGFSLDSRPSDQDNNISYPTRCGKYTVFEYEDSFKSEKISCYDVLVYIDKIDDGVYGDEENLILEIKINPSIEVSTSPYSNKIHIGFTRYDNVGFVGVKAEPFFLATVKDAASPQASRKKFYLKNSLPAKEWGFKPGDIVESSTIDISGKSSLNFLEDFIGIVKTIRGYNEDRKRGTISFKRTDQADIHEQIIEVICKYAWKNTKKIPKNLVNESGLGLNSKVKKKFDKVDAIDNISDYVDLGLPSGTLWCSHNYGADNEYECGNLYNHEDATELDLLPGQLPSPEDFRELNNFCKHKRSEVSGVKGMMFISKKNSNEIFFPIADHYEGIYFDKPNGYYWSSERFQNDGAYNMKFDLSPVIGEGFVNICNTSYRSYGFLVRTVLKKANESNLGLNSKVKKHYSSNSAETIAEELGKYPGSLDESFDFFIKDLLNDKEHNGENKWIENPDAEKSGENGEYHIRKKDLNDRNSFDFAPYGIIMYYRIGGMNLGLYFVLDENDHPCFLMSGFSDSFLNWAFDNDINIKTRLVSEVPDYRDRKISTLVNIFDCTFESLRGLATYLNKRYYDSNHPLKKSHKVNEGFARKIKANLGLNNKVKKKFNDADAVGNVSQIHFEDPEVERICHEHDVYTVDDAAKVTSIKGWFKDNDNIKSFNELKFFTGLKEIEIRVFGWCRSLQSITIPDDVTSIGEGAFTFCEHLQSINIPDGVTSIGGFAFNRCKSLQSVTIPNSVTSIKDMTFYACSSLQSINIPDSVTSIGDNTFSCCNSLELIYISKNCPVYSLIRKAYSGIQLIEPKVNESSSLGLNNKVKKKFNDIDATENLMLDFIDLGLPSGNLWRNCNDQASSIEDSGMGYTFGEAKRTCFSIGEIPNADDFKELFVNCDFVWDNSRKGMVVTSKANKASIFLPAAGYIGNIGGAKNLGLGKYGCYWMLPGEHTGEPHRGSAFSFMISDEGDVKALNVNSDHMKYPVRCILRGDKDKINEGLTRKIKEKYDKTPLDSDEDKVFNAEISCLRDIEEIYEFLKSRIYFKDSIYLSKKDESDKYIKILFEEKNGYVIRYLNNSNYIEIIDNRLCIFSTMAYSRKESKFLETIPGLHCINPMSVKRFGPFCAFYGDNGDNNVMPIESLEAIAEYVNFIYRDRDKKKVDESALGLANKVKKQFKEDYSGDKVVNVLEPFFDCQDETGKQVKVYFSESDWKNKIFKWLYENVSTLKIKEDDKYRAKYNRSKVLVDDFITNKFEGGQISICMYHHEYSTWGPPSYITDLANYFNGVETYPLILTAHNLGNYSFCAVKLWTQGSKWRLTSAAYYQDRLYKSIRCPQGGWRKAKKTVTAKDVPILNLLGTKKKKESSE